MLDDKVRAIDYETIAILFRNQPLRTGKYSEWCLSPRYEKEKRPERMLVDSFYGPLQERLSNLMPPLEKTKREIKVKREYPFKGEKVIHIPINNFLMASYGMMGGKSLEYFPTIRKDKEREVIMLYEDSWVKPLPNINAIQRRQQELRELVEDKPYADGIDALAQSLNNILLPHLHLSSLTKLLVSNTLGASRSMPIHRKDQDAFYQDYLRFCREFVRWYDEAKDISSSVQPTSQNMKGTVKGICSILAESPLVASYKTARNLVDDAPASFGKLRERVMACTSGKPLVTQEKLEKLTEMVRNEARKARDFYFEHPPEWLRIFQEDKSKKGSVMATEKEYMDFYLYKEQMRRLGYFSIKSGLTVPWPFAQSDNAIVTINRLANHFTAALSHAEYIRNKEGWTVPNTLPKRLGVIDIKNGWYPLTPLYKGEKFAYNDTYLNGQQRVEILDGTNRGGKTIDMRKTAFAVVCALAGNYVPAGEGTRISYFDNVYIRLRSGGLNDQSALEQELNSTHKLIEKIKSGSAALVCIDEPWSSTNAKEGEGLTYGLVRRISEIRQIAEIPSARGVFAIHYPQMRQHTLGIEGVAHSHFEYSEENGEVITNHQKLPGPNPQPGYAFVIARAEGLHPQVLAHAMRLYREKHHEK